MSSTIQNLNTFVGEKLREAFGANPVEVITAGDSRLKVFTNFLDGLIKHGYNDGEKDVKLSAGEVLRAVEVNIKANKNLSQVLQKILNEKKDAHLSGARQNISKELLSHLGAVNLVTGSLQAKAKVPKAPAEGYENPVAGEIENIFYSKLQSIYHETKSLSAEERKVAFEERVADITGDIYGKYGSKATQALAEKINDASAISFTFAKTSSHGLRELPQILDSEKLKEGDKSTFDKLMNSFKNGDYSALSADEKAKVLDLISHISENAGKESIALELKKEGLSFNEKAYYEHLRKEASEISNNGSSVADLISNLTNKLPDLLMPAIIGAVIGYLMGGMEMMGAFGAGAISLLGSSTGDIGSELNDQKPRTVPPPVFGDK